MKGFIISAQTLSDETKTYVQLFGKLENGESCAIMQEYVPYFYIEEKHLLKLKGVLSQYKVESISWKNFSGEKVAKISAPTTAAISKLTKFLHNKEIDTYEADLKPHQQFLIERDIKGSFNVEGDYETADRINRVYRNQEIKSAIYTPKLKVISIDLESDKNHDNLFCIGIYGEKVSEVFMITSKKIKGVISCKDEAECLEKFKKRIVDLDPDIITGWNVIDFDFDYLKKRFEKNRVLFDMARDNSEVRVRIESSFFKDSKVMITGRQVLDGLNLIKDPFIQEAPSIRNIEIESWTLEDVAQAILKEGKIISGKNRHQEIEELYRKDQEKLAKYNLQDAKLAYHILEKSQTLELAIERCQLTGLTLDRLTASIAAFDSLYIREAHKKGIVSPTTKYEKKEERIKGGYVMDSKPGIYHNVLVLDFKSLYPSVMKTLNIDPASFTNKGGKDIIETPNHAHFKNQEGVLPIVLERLHEAREKAKKEKRELASYAIKIIMNSFFGVLANPNCRYFSLEIANAITHSAQEIIKLTAKKIEDQGFSIIYSDTDSIFLEIKEKDNAKEVGKKLTNMINDFYKKYIKEEYNRSSFLELEFKRHYIAFMLPKIRNLEKGSKKRYAGLVENDGKEEIEIVGLEAIRGDWTEAAQEFQKELLRKVFKREEFIKFIKEYVKKVEQGKLDSKLVYTKSLRKSLDEYTKTTPPHVKAARQLESLESDTIQYVITVKGPEPIQKLKDKIDYEHYIEKQIAPIANAILTFFDTNFEDMMKASKQKKLFE